VFFSNLMGDDLLTWLDDFFLFVAFGNEDFLLNNVTLILLLLLILNADLPENAHDATAATESNDRSDGPSITTASCAAFDARSAESSIVADPPFCDDGLPILGVVSSSPSGLPLARYTFAAVRGTFSFSTAQPAGPEARDSFSVHGLLIVA